MKSPDEYSNMSLMFKQIEDSVKRVYRYSIHTPLYYSDVLSDLTSARVYLKLENYQPIGSFKIRGASNKILKLDKKEISKGFVAASSGNHGLAVSYIAKRLGVKATIVVPENAVPSKIEAINRLESDIIYFGRRHVERLTKAMTIASNEGKTFIPSFDDPDIIAGQGTIGLEIARSLKNVETVIVPVGGGGLISGVATALKSLNPSIRVYGVQAKGAPSMYRSLMMRRPIRLRSVNTIADGLAPGEAGKYTYQIVKNLVNKVFLVNDDEISNALFFSMEKCRLFIEPSAAVTLAVLKGVYRPRKGEKIALLISGGNLSLDLLKKIVNMFL